MDRFPLIDHPGMTATALGYRWSIHVNGVDEFRIKQHTADTALGDTHAEPHTACRRVFDEGLSDIETDA